MKVIVFVSVALLQLAISAVNANHTQSGGEQCQECEKCWKFNPFQVNTSPWNRKRYYAVLISQVQDGTVWGPYCGIFNKCSKTACGCIGADVYTVNNRRIEGAFFSYDRSQNIQYVRRFRGIIPSSGGYGEIEINYSRLITWTIPAETVERVNSEHRVERYTVPEQSIKVIDVPYKIKAILISLNPKFRILIFCSGLKGINGNRPFATVLATMPQPGRQTWRQINAALRNNNLEPRSMTLLRHENCIYPPFEWCVQAAQKY